jgi:hypothetical protein
MSASERRRTDRLHVASTTWDLPVRTSTSDVREVCHWCSRTTSFPSQLSSLVGTGAPSSLLAARRCRTWGCAARSITATQAYGFSSSWRSTLWKGQCRFLVPGVSAECRPEQRRRAQARRGPSRCKGKPFQGVVCKAIVF